MSDFFEIDKKNKTVKTMNLDDFSIEDLKKYIDELYAEVSRVKIEIERKDSIKKKAEDFFK